jgi:PAS domain S-box-containing protein
MRALIEAKGGEASENDVTTLTERVNDAMLEGVLVWGSCGEILHVNDSLCSMLGRTSHELVGKPAAQYFGEIPARSRRAKPIDARQRFETQLCTKDGGAIMVDVCSERIEDARGNELGAFAVMIDITARANALRQSESEVRLLSAQFMAAQELERQRIARELHDSVGQALGGVKFGLETCEALISAGSSEAALSAIRQYAARIQSVVEEVRSISMNLRPSTLDDLGILPTLGWFAREFRAIYGQVEVEVLVDVAEDEIAVPVKTAVYRIVQEAFNNVVKHAKARNITLSLRHVASQVELRIYDDGSGFEAGARGAGGLGLGSMRERAEVTGGRFSVESRNGEGTTVRVMWPRYHGRPAQSQSDTVG